MLGLAGSRCARGGGAQSRISHRLEQFRRSRRSLDDGLNLWTDVAIGSEGVAAQDDARSLDQ